VEEAGDRQWVFAPVIRPRGVLQVSEATNFRFGLNA
jgi:hypothetical protein